MKQKNKSIEAKQPHTTTTTNKRNKKANETNRNNKQIKDKSKQTEQNNISKYIVSNSKIIAAATT